MRARTHKHAHVHSSTDRHCHRTELFVALLVCIRSFNFGGARTRSHTRKAHAHAYIRYRVSVGKHAASRAHTRTQTRLRVRTLGLGTRGDTRARTNPHTPKRTHANTLSAPTAPIAVSGMRGPPQVHAAPCCRSERARGRGGGAAHARRRHAREGQVRVRAAGCYFGRRSACAAPPWPTGIASMHCRSGCARTHGRNSHSRTHRHARTRTHTHARADGSSCSSCAFARRQTPLHWAASRGKYDVVRLLVANRADVAARDNNW